MSHFFLLILYMFFIYLVLNFIIHLLCLGCNKRYIKLDGVKQVEYRANVIGPVHSVISVVFATLAMFFVCGDGVTVFNSEECFNTARYLHIWALVNTCGYFVQDTFNIVVL